MGGVGVIESTELIIILCSYYAFYPWEKCPIRCRHLNAKAKANHEIIHLEQECRMSRNGEHGVYMET